MMASRATLARMLAAATEVQVRSALIRTCTTGWWHPGSGAHQRGEPVVVPVEEHVIGRLVDLAEGAACRPAGGRRSSRVRRSPPGWPCRRPRPRPRPRSGVPGAPGRSVPAVWSHGCRTVDAGRTCPAPPGRRGRVRPASRARPRPWRPAGSRPTAGAGVPGGGWARHPVDGRRRLGPPVCWARLSGHGRNLLLGPDRVRHHRSWLRTTLPRALRGSSSTTRTSLGCL